MKYYNIFIEHNQDQRQYILVINENQLNILIDAFVAGESYVMLKGVERNIRDPRKFIIYSLTNPAQFGSKQGDIQRNFEKYKILTQSKKISLELFKKFGDNITDDILKHRRWGDEARHNAENSKKQKSSQVPGKIFISHSSADSEIVIKFCDLILDNGLKIDLEKEVFNTSLDASKPKNGEDFRKRIKEELLDAKLVLQFISENYKKSEVCLNEMGAAWVLSDKVKPLVIKNYDVGFINNTVQQIQLSEKSDILHFVQELKDLGIITDFHIARLGTKVEEFVRFLKLDKSKVKKTPIKTTPPKITKSVNLYPFFRIGNHSGIYYRVKFKFHEIPDSHTLHILGFDEAKPVPIVDLTPTMRDPIGNPIKSVFSGEICSVKGQDKVWLLYENKRHHIANTDTLQILLHRGAKPRSLDKDTLFSFKQGNVYNLVNKKLDLI